MRARGALVLDHQAGLAAELVVLQPGAGLGQLGLAVAAVEALLVRLLARAQNDVGAVDRLAADVAGHAVRGELRVVLAAQVARDADVLVQLLRADRALQTVRVVELVVHSNAAVDQMVAARRAALAEKVQIVVAAVDVRVLLEDAALLRERRIAVVAEEARVMIHLPLHARKVGVVHGLLAEIALLRGQRGVVRFAIRLLVELVVLAVLKRLAADNTHEVVRVVEAAERLRATMRS